MLHRRIPRVAAAALVFGGCSDESNVDSSERLAIESAAMELCAARSECDPYALSMNPYYSDVESCIDFIYGAQLELVEDGTNGWGEACGDAGIAYFECYAAAVADDCYGDMYVDSLCADEILARDTYCSS